MKRSKFLSYSSLAWTEPFLAPPKAHAKETIRLVKLIRRLSKNKARTLLHIGCGAGGHDFTFKKHFHVTGVDIAPHMLRLAKKLNPKVVYIRGDMRSVKLKKRFDAVAIPDSIGYMTSKRDLKHALKTAFEHLKPGGVLIATALLREKFRENNFVYSGAAGGLKITVFENNSLPRPSSTFFEAAMIYLIRRQGRAKVFSEIHRQGLFPLKAWKRLLKGTGFSKIMAMSEDHLYDRFLHQDGRYQLSVFVCLKPPEHISVRGFVDKQKRIRVTAL